MSMSTFNPSDEAITEAARFAAMETVMSDDPYDDLVYDGELGWIDPDPKKLLDSIGIGCQVGREYLYYSGVDMNEWRVPRFGDWARLRACIEDAERRSKEDGAAS